ncbi:c6 zinc finger domain containing protein [Grosmannia clavigera kw1407]|uniref:C6 zinc finger domain containing protein n=1 Tax=Grosmannia clavigera (strain kw1407 / UAMH 11150) TaxID=655863 RepID=F0XEU7_GROCL|nr:c6 zinc finger domain containing protein [Grosmannia clavigera kw1407]EFX04526.1 c6 zinc finger domain containing protein [Grosmannia clavigera kw1407]
MATFPTTLPASWYTSKAIGDLERRAVFLQTWILLGAVTKWPNVGERYANSLAEVELFVQRVSEDWRSIQVFSAADGSAIRSHLTATGLLFVTLSEATVSFDDFFPGLEELIGQIDFQQFAPRRSLEYEGRYNWKAMMDGYQECLHCPYAHPSFAKVYRFATYRVLNRHNYSQHIAATDRPNDGLFLYFFPNSTLNLYGGGMSSFRAWPTADPRRSTVDFDYYHVAPESSDTFDTYFRFARTVAVEDHDLCEKVQQNLDVGIYTEGILNPDKENGVAYYQSRVLEMCAAQYEKEKESLAGDSVAVKREEIPSVFEPETADRNVTSIRITAMESPSSAVAQANWAETRSFDEPAKSATTRTPEPAYRHTKSRNGCVTCKARRRKCDEAKPSCSQCARRRVTCGGYSSGLRWKEFSQPEPAAVLSGRKGAARSSRQRRAAAASPGSHGGQTPPRLPDTTANILFAEPAETLEPLVDMDLLLADIHATLEGPSGLEDNLLVDYRLVNGDEDDTAGLPSFFHGSTDAEAEMVDLDLDLLEAEDDDSTATVTGWQLPFEAMATAASSSSSSAVSSSSTTAKLAHTLYQHPRFHSGSPEHIAFLFNRRICEVLCIRDDGTAGNPWRRIVWPLAQDHAALYHAVAAMTCFQGANRLPQFRAEGLRHLNTSIQQMYGSRGESNSSNSSNMRLEVALAVTLVLGFAETWYYPRSSTGIRFVQRAKGLLQTALTDKSNDSSSDLICLRFLANTWVYMDVISRFTCHGLQTVDTRFMAAWRRLDPQPHTATRRMQVDPLMGTAATLFPLIGRVADLVNRVHGSTATSSSEDPNDLNPPGLVAEAVELKMAIERWRPAELTDEEDVVEDLNADSATPPSSSSASDLVQTADAYKWASLLLLHQAVPELPRPRTSLPARLARRVLVMLATVPLGSRAVIFPVLPLLIAGCEADNRADRDWVRQRWHALSIGNSSGIVDRCLELTLEVWRRRDGDVHWRPRRRQHRQHRQQAGSFPDWTQNRLVDNRSSSPRPDDNGDFANPFTLPPWSAAAAPFSESLQPAQPRESDCSPFPTPEYTVKSRQHWLSVMRDWGWEG